MTDNEKPSFPVHLDRNHLPEPEWKFPNANPEPAGELRFDERVQQRDPALGEVDEHLGADFSVEDGIEPEAREANDEGVAIRRGDVGDKGAIVGLKQPVKNQIETSVLGGEPKSLGPRQGKLRQVRALVGVGTRSCRCFKVCGGLVLSWLRGAGESDERESAKRHRLAAPSHQRVPRRCRGASSTISASIIAQQLSRK